MNRGSQVPAAIFLRVNKHIILAMGQSYTFINIPQPSHRKGRLAGLIWPQRTDGLMSLPSRSAFCLGYPKGLPKFSAAFCQEAQKKIHFEPSSYIFWEGKLSKVGFERLRHDSVPWFGFWNHTPPQVPIHEKWGGPTRGVRKSDIKRGKRYMGHLLMPAGVKSTGRRPTRHLLVLLPS